MGRRNMMALLLALGLLAVVLYMPPWSQSTTTGGRALEGYYGYGYLRVHCHGGSVAGGLYSGVFSAAGYRFRSQPRLACLARTRCCRRKVPDLIFGFAG